MLSKKDLPDCPVATTVDLIGSKWKLLILRDLLNKPCRFQELKRDLDGISHKVLTASLRSMENDGLVKRTTLRTIPVGVEYSLTELGESMREILFSMQNWGLKYRELHKKDEP